MNLRSAIRLASAALALAALAFAPLQTAVAADTVDPVADAKAFKKFFTDKFPKVKLEDFVNGPYSMNADMHRQWEEKEQFPPYEFSLDMGKEMFTKPFKNGKSYEDCFPNKGIGIRQNYPYFDEKEGKVITLELALNRCREANGEPPFSYVRDEMAALTAYMAFTSRGKPFDIKIPNDPRALGPTRRAGILLTRPAHFPRHLPWPGERIRARVRARAGILTMPIYRQVWSAWAPPAAVLRTLSHPRRAITDDEYAISNIICPMSATDRSPARERGHEPVQDIPALARLGAADCGRDIRARRHRD